MLPPDLAGLRTPALRHIAWMLTAPQLVEDAASFHPRIHVSASALEILRAWDNHPEKLPASLAAAPRRLGLYFEHLYVALMSDLFGWSIVTRNLPIRSSARTLGELDFLLRNPASGAVEHHEIAIKFYLGHCDDVDKTVRWYGPDSRDRLDLKIKRLLDHQCRLTKLPETQATLDALGLPQPTRARVFMPGYLFYPLDAELVSPASAAADHLRGYWLSFSELASKDTSTWVALDKPHWLGSWRQGDMPDPDRSKQVLQLVQTKNYPRLFAALEPLPDGSTWRERARYFVVPDSWPGRYSSLSTCSALHHGD